MHKDNDEDMIENTYELNEEQDNKKGNIPFNDIKSSQNENNISYNNQSRNNKHQKNRSIKKCRYISFF